MSFTFSGSCDDQNNWSVSVDVPNGATVTHLDVIRVLAWATAQFAMNPGQRLPTVAESAAMKADYEANCAPPSGWEHTLDGVNTTLTDGVPSYSRTYRRAGFDADAKFEAPCDANGNAIPGTRAALVAYDTEHPVVVDNGKPAPPALVPPPVA